MTRLLMDAVLIVSVTASLIATAEVEGPPVYRVPQGGIMTNRRVIVRVVEVDRDGSTTGLRASGPGSARLPLSPTVRDAGARHR